MPWLGHYDMPLMVFLMLVISCNDWFVMLCNGVSPECSVPATQISQPALLSPRQIIRLYKHLNLSCQLHQPGQGSGTLFFTSLILERNHTDILESIICIMQLEAN